jgi:general secretion pathway protein G
MDTCIVLIEDNHAYRELMSGLLAARGHQPVCAADGERGLAAVQRAGADLVLCDIHLPQMDGFEVVRRLKSDPATRAIPVVAVTSGGIVSREHALAAGFDGFIAKPIVPKTFVPEVEHFLVRREHPRVLIERGFTLVELMIVLAIVAVLAAVAMPAYGNYVDRVHIGLAIGDIGEISRRIKQYQLESGTLPADLSAVGAETRRDPWGNPYAYVNLQADSKSKSNASIARKNKNLVPINSDYDLYSIGKDGKSKLPLTAKDSRDDIVRANDGSFVGLASAFAL